jgi:hypothetical protein
MVPKNNLSKYYKESYTKDKRLPVSKIYQAIYSLGKNKNWEITQIDTHTILKNKTKIEFPLLSLKTKTKGKAVWIIAGIHGEEPAGTVAIIKNLNFFKKLANKKIPLVLIPLANPSGYFRDWRYLEDPLDWESGKSVGDSEHLLLKNSKQPRLKQARSKYSKTFTEYILNLTKTYPPQLVLDFHEDDPKTTNGDPRYNDDINNPSTYTYSDGKYGTEDIIAKEITKILKKHKQPIVNSGTTTTKEKEKIVEGIVGGMKDNSIEELFASDKIYYKNKISPGPAVQSIITIETSATVPIKKRIKIFSEIIHQINHFINKL